MVAAHKCSHSGLSLLPPLLSFLNGIILFVFDIYPIAHFWATLPPPPHLARSFSFQVSRIVPNCTKLEIEGDK